MPFESSKKSAAYHLICVLEGAAVAKIAQPAGPPIGPEAGQRGPVMRLAGWPVYRCPRPDRTPVLGRLRLKGSVDFLHHRSVHLLERALMASGPRTGAARWLNRKRPRSRKQAK